jgi:hypothetical protein
MPGLDLTQNQLDDVARLICEQSMATKDKELFARAFAKRYEVTRTERFARMSMIPQLDEDLADV